MTFDLPKLGYTYDALEPYLSEDIVFYHYGKHTKKYFKTLNELVKGTVYADFDSLDTLIRSKRIKDGTKIYNNACQAWNHQFYWNCLAPKSECGKLSEKLNTAIDTSFKSFDNFVEAFNEEATDHFSNGWCWLMLTDGKLRIASTPDADNPIVEHMGIPLLTIDLWEHAHYLQYPADRAKYLDNIWSVVNWNFVNKQYE